MSRVYAFGETIYDITFRNGQPVAAWPGGALLNTGVTLGRLRVPVSLISEFGYDTIGNRIDSFLQDNGVSTSHIARYHNGKTAVSMAFLDKRNEAEYSFYKDYPPKRLQVTLPDFRPGDFFLFGSFFALNRDIRPRLLDMLHHARENNVLIMYDPNYRKTHINELSELRILITENISHASLVRGSDEDFYNIFGAATPDEAYRAVSHLSPVMIYTTSDKAVYLRTPGLSVEIPVPRIKTISTIGAGDTFNAGIVYEMYRKGIRPSSLKTLTGHDWKEILHTGITLAGEVCKHYENYIPKDFALSYKPKFRN